MVKVNIPKSNDDPTYRYKRDKIEIEIHNNNGGMTKLNNIEIISNQIGCELDEILKFIKKSINVNLIQKNGIFIRKIETQNNIEEKIEDYIQKEILCKKCKNPEFIKEKNKKICKACGNIIIKN
jgi:translation initiation factor 2 beta subunit (eIF-2beta)/eIF-5